MPAWNETGFTWGGGEGDTGQTVKHANSFLRAFCQVN